MIYTYSIGGDTSDGSCNQERLHSEINIAGFVGTSSEGDELSLSFQSELSPEDKAELDAVISAHTAAPTAEESIASSVRRAINFGVELMTELAVSNVLAGYNSAQIKAISDYLADIQRYVGSGSLPIALVEIQALSPLVVDGVELISQAQIDSFASKIQTYLG